MSTSAAASKVVSSREYYKCCERAETFRRMVAMEERGMFGMEFLDDVDGEMPPGDPIPEVGPWWHHCL